MLNKTIIMGRLVRAPELKQTQSGLSVTSFSVAVERDFKDKGSGEKITDDFDVVAWRQTAEFVCKYFSKGRMIVVDGKLQSRKWDDRNGNKRTSIEIVADSCYFGDSKKDSNNGSYQQGPPPQQQSLYPQGSYPQGGYSQGGYQQSGYGGGYPAGYGGPPAQGQSGYPPSDYDGFQPIEGDGVLPF